METHELVPVLEALLFAADTALPSMLLAEACETDLAAVSEALLALQKETDAAGRGVRLAEMAGGWIFVTRDVYAPFVARMLRGKKKMRLSRPALETLAIIAYKQPVTKSEVEAIRGVDSSGVMATLLERNLVTIRGRSKVVGRPLLYGTTQEFLDYFGLKDLTELPRPEELRALVAAREPEQLDMMEVEVVSQVATDLAAGEAVAGTSFLRHEVEPLAVGDDLSENDDEDDEDDDEAEFSDDEFEDDEDDDEGDDEDDDGDDEETADSDHDSAHVEAERRS